MTQYELTFLLNEEAELKTLKDLVSSLKGKIVKEEKWGEKKLAYPIKKSHSAVFYNWEIDMDVSTIEEFKKKLNFNEKLIRYLLLTKEE